LILLPFSPIFLAQKSEWLVLPKRVAAFWECPKEVKGGTRKAEDVKLQDAGISPKQCPRK
jgi:hypothetical protein